MLEELEIYFHLIHFLLGFLAGAAFALIAVAIRDGLYIRKRMNELKIKRQRRPCKSDNE